MRHYDVKDGKKVVITCIECGCRLSNTGEGYEHFMGAFGRDARGCKCSLINIKLLSKNQNINYRG